MLLHGHDVYAYEYTGDDAEDVAGEVWEQARDAYLEHVSVWRTTNTARSRWLVVVADQSDGFVAADLIDFRAGVRIELPEDECLAFLTRRHATALGGLTAGKTEIRETTRFGPRGARLELDGSLVVAVGGDGPREATDDV